MSGSRGLAQYSSSAMWQVGRLKRIPQKLCTPFFGMGMPMHLHLHSHTPPEGVGAPRRRWLEETKECLAKDVELGRTTKDWLDKTPFVFLLSSFSPQPPGSSRVLEESEPIFFSLVPPLVSCRHSGRILDDAGIR